MNRHLVTAATRERGRPARPGIVAPVGPGCLRRRLNGLLGSAGLLVILYPSGGCSTGDPAERMIAAVDRMPPEQRPPNWEVTRSRMIRPAPRVGDLAPDFTLPQVDGSERLTRSTFQGDRPIVIAFGSFT